MLIIFLQDSFFKDLTRRCEAHIIVLALIVKIGLC